VALFGRGEGGGKKAILEGFPFDLLPVTVKVYVEAGLGKEAVFEGIVIAKRGTAVGRGHWEWKGIRNRESRIGN